MNEDMEPLSFSLPVCLEEIKDLQTSIETTQKSLDDLRADVFRHAISYLYENGLTANDMLSYLEQHKDIDIQTERVSQLLNTYRGHPHVWREIDKQNGGDTNEI